MDNQRICIEDGVTVKLFKRSDLSFVRTLGREGQGPGEFQDFASPQILPDCILVSSTNKISYFSLDGDLIKEKRGNIGISSIRAIKNKYIGYSIRNEPDDFYVVYVLYDSDLKPLTELHRGKWLIHKNRRRDLFEILFYDTDGERIVLAHRNAMAIDILDSEGSVIHSIKYDVKPVPFRNEDREKVMEYWRDRRYNQEQIESLKKRTDLPDYYPPLQTCCVADGKIYVITYARKKDGYECYVYDLDGKYRETVYLPLNMLAPHIRSPFTISGDKLYQLVYDYDKEQWELRVNRIVSPG